MTFIKSDYIDSLTFNKVTSYKAFKSAIVETETGNQVLFQGHDGNDYLICHPYANEENSDGVFLLIVLSVPLCSDVSDVIALEKFDTYTEALAEMVNISKTDYCSC